MANAGPYFFGTVLDFIQVFPIFSPPKATAGLEMMQ